MRAQGSRRLPWWRRWLAAAGFACAFVITGCSGDSSSARSAAGATPMQAATRAAPSACERYIVSATARGLVVEAYMQRAAGSERFSGYRRALMELRTIVPWGQEGALGPGAQLLERMFSANDEASRGLLVNDIGMFAEASARADRYLEAFERGLVEAGCATRSG